VTKIEIFQYRKIQTPGETLYNEQNEGSKETENKKRGIGFTS